MSDQFSASDPAPTAETIVTALSLALVDLAALRCRVKDETDYQQALLDAVRASPDFVQSEERRSTFSTRLAEAEDNVRALALHAFSLTGVKSRNGIQIKERTTKAVEYDYATAVAWAREKAPELIVLDQKLFEAHVLANAATIPIPCAKVVVTKKLEAQIARDLRELDLLALIK